MPTITLFSKTTFSLLSNLHLNACIQRQPFTFMNKQKLKELLPVMQAWVEGKEIEVSQINENKYELYEGDTPEWLFGNLSWKWRIKPSPNYRPWKTEEVPLGAWLRWINEKMIIYLIVTVVDEQLYVIGKSISPVDLDVILKYCEHSTDKGKTWHPCGVRK